MKKLFTLLALVWCAATGAWADTAYLYMDGTTAANSMTLENGFTIAITGNTSKAFSNGNGKITLDKTEYQTMKNSNGAQITVTCPTNKIATHIDFYVVTNDGSTKGKLQEFDGATTSDEVSSLKDYANPTKISKDIASKSSFTFTFGTKQVCFVAVVTYAADVKAAPTVLIPSTADAYANVASSISATISANPAVTGIKWYSCDDADKTNPVEVSGQTTSTLSYTIATAGTYYYYCSATNDKGTTNSNVCVVTVTAKPISSECTLTNLVLSNGFNTAIKNNTITGYYLKGETAPTIKSAIVSEYATYALDGTKLTVTAEDGTTKTEYTYNVTEVEPLTSTEKQSVTSETPAWLKLGVWNSGKSSHEIYKAVDEASNMRITEGKNRVYLFVGPCDAVILTNASSSESTDRTGTYSVNGADATNVTFPKYVEGGATIAIPCSKTGNNMVELVNTATGGSWGFDAVQLMNYQNITFSCTDTEAVGSVPTVAKVVPGTMKIPANQTLYKEGYTLTAWNDGTNDYAIGETYTPTANATLTPLFTANTVTLNETNSNLSVVWKFGEKDGAPSFTNGITLVNQITVNGQTIDLGINAATGSNKGRNDIWTSTGKGNYTIPVKKGSEIKLNFYDLRQDPVVVNGETLTASGSTNAQVYTYTYNGSETSVIMSCNSGYLSTITVSYPVTQVSASVGTTGWASFTSPIDFTVAKENEVYYASEANSSTISLTALEAGAKVKAGEGVLVNGEGTHTFESATEATEISGNLLVGATEDKDLAEESAYILANQDGKAVFSLCTAGTIAAGKAYLPNTTASAARTLQFVTDDANSIKNAVESKMQKSGAYNLAGQKVGADYKGIVIENGVKVIKK